MKTLYCICPDAQTNKVYVAAVGGNEPLRYGAAYEVSDELALLLLENAGDWSESAPDTSVALASPPEGRRLWASPEIGEPLAVAPAKDGPGDLASAKDGD